MSITKENYDEYVKKSFFTEKNFSGKYTPKNLDDNMIPTNKLAEFHYQTSFFLNFYATLYIELKKYEKDMTYNITKFADTIENLVINIDNTIVYGTGIGKTYKISAFSSNKYTFYVKTFEAKISTQNQLYTAATGSSNPATETAAYDNAYSDILSNSIPYFGSYPNTLVPVSDAYIQYLTTNTLSPQSYFKDTDLNKSNYKSKMPGNVSKFKKILEEVFSQTPENILGYLLYKKIHYNIILYNIAIQNSIITNYLYKTIADINTTPNIYINGRMGEIDSYNSTLVPILTQINDNIKNINKLISTNFSNNNDYLLEKNEYRNKITTLNNLKDEYKKIQDKLNISTKLYNQQFKNYKSIKTYATYVIISLIIIIISIIYISIFPIFSIETKNALYIILLVLLVIITFLYYTNFKYVNLYEKFTTYYYIASISAPSSPSAPNVANTGYIVGERYTMTISTGDGNSIQPNSKAELGTISVDCKSTSFVLGVYTIGSGYGGTGYSLNDSITFTPGSDGTGAGATGKVAGITADTNSITLIEITATGAGYKSTPNMVINRATSSPGSVNANFPLNFGKIDDININTNTILYVNNIVPTAVIDSPPSSYTAVTAGSATATNIVITTTRSAASISTRTAIKTIALTSTTDVDKYTINDEGIYYTLAQTGNLRADKTIISSSCASDVTHTYMKTFNGVQTFINNHKTFYNKLLPKINEYSNAYNDLLNNMRLNVYTIGSKSFSQDANIYLYNLYLEKKRQIEINNVKLTNFFNMIEVIKKQINYLFNIIFFIACFSIILLIALVIYSTAPHLYIFVIILCIVLISILMIYFTFAIIQPTRMIANKNYWAILNPSKTTYSKL